jgi:predicted dehydrogenase
VTKPVRTAVVGLGGRGIYLAGQYDRRSHPGFELCAVCDLDPVRFRQIEARYGDSVTYHTDLHEMLVKADVDAVLVATNDPHHVEPTIAALRAGKHVLVEKPLCQTVADARRIIDEARQATGIFMIGFELREVSVFRQLKEFAEAGRIGDIKIGHAFDNVSVGGDYFFHDPARQRGFYRTLLLQKASHSLDLLNWLMGSHPVKVYGIGGLDFYGGKEDPDLRCRECTRAAECPYRVHHEGFTMDYGAVIEKPDYCVWSKAMDLNDNSELCISYANGGKATFHECHFTPDYTREFWFVGTRGKIYGYYDNPGRFLIRLEYSHSRERRTEEFKPPYEGGSHGGGDDNLRNEFYRRIMEHDPPREAVESAYYSTALAICAEQSIETGQAVVIPSLGMASTGA